MSNLVVLVHEPQMNDNIDRVVEWASKPAHYWVPGKTNHPAGDERYQVHVGEYTCIYCITNYSGTLARELAVSHVSGRPATPGVMRLLATFFGFGGADYSVATEPSARRSVALQLLDQRVL